MKTENDSKQDANINETTPYDFYDEVFKELLGSGEVKKIEGFYHFYLGGGFDDC